MCCRLIKVRIPCVVAIQPAGVVATLLPHPRIGARNGLYNGRARFAMGFIPVESPLDVLTIHRIETTGKNGSVLDRSGRALRHVGVIG